MLMEFLKRASRADVIQEPALTSQRDGISSVSRKTEEFLALQHASL
jgi:hypothetical protein